MKEAPVTAAQAEACGLRGAVLVGVVSPPVWERCSDRGEFVGKWVRNVGLGCCEGPHLSAVGM